jgi:hypothetical protein
MGSNEMCGLRRVGGLEVVRSPKSLFSRYEQILHVRVRTFIIREEGFQA